MPEPPPQLVIGMMGLFLLIMGLAFAGLPGGECDENRCAHCRDRRLERAGRKPPDNGGE